MKYQGCVICFNRQRLAIAATFSMTTAIMMSAKKMADSI